MMTDIKLCPFCGTEPIFEACDIGHCNCGCGFIMCNSDDCLVSPEVGFGKEGEITVTEAIAAWNGRSL